MFPAKPCAKIRHDSLVGRCRCGQVHTKSHAASEVLVPVQELWKELPQLSLPCTFDLLTATSSAGAFTLPLYLKRAAELYRLDLVECVSCCSDKPALLFTAVLAAAVYPQ